MANALMEPASTTSRPNVLLVEDDTLLAEAYQAYLGKEDWLLAVAHTGRDALAAIERLGPEVILLDLLLPDMHGLKIVDFITTREVPVSVVVITSQGSIKTAVEAMRAGAWDFLVKPVSAERLVYTLRNALDRHRLHRTVQTYEETFARERYCGFIGASPQMQLVYRIIDSAAQSRATVFVTGESGTGKELCAEAIYRMSPRSNGPFVVVNCAAIPKDLMESEIFGHVEGAFTGATSDRKGAAALADGGTLFFDEICEMDTALQAKLLGFVQGGTFQRIGGSNEIKVDVRIICATNRDLLAEVESGAVPRGPLLSPARGAYRPAAAAPARRRCAAHRSPLLGEIRQGGGAPLPGVRAGRGSGPARPSLARQRAPIAERDSQHRRPERRRGRDPGHCCRRRSTASSHPARHGRMPWPRQRRAAIPPTPFAPYGWRRGISSRRPYSFATAT